jgi:Tfp pilus assembly protein PilN
MQQINFYFSEYHPKPLSFDSRFAGITLLIVIVVLFSFSLFESMRLEKSQKDLSEKKQQLSKLESNILIAQKELAKKLNKQHLPEKIAFAQKQLNTYKKLALAINRPIQPPPVKYSEILNALSERRTESVWLTDIYIKDQHLSLTGATTKKERIPDYVMQLNQARTLKREFDEFNIDLDSSNQKIIIFKLLNGRLMDG